MVQGLEAGLKVAGEVSPFVQRDELAETVPGLVLWEEELQEALTGHLFGLLLAEVSGLPEETLLEEADLKVPD